MVIENRLAGSLGQVLKERTAEVREPRDRVLVCRVWEARRQAAKRLRLFSAVRTAETMENDPDPRDENVTVSHEVTGGDYEANGVTAEPVVVTVTDDERPSDGKVLVADARRRHRTD